MGDITRRDVLRGAIAVTAIGVQKGSAALAPKLTAGERPNILCLCFEDGPPHFGACGDSLAHTPTTDRLARQGVVYTILIHSPRRLREPGCRWFC